MTMADDPSHPLYPAFETIEQIPPRAYVVLYKGYSTNWLATTPFYTREAACRMGSLLDRDVKILELQTIGVSDLTEEERKFFKKHKVRAIRTEPEQPTVTTVTKVRKVRRVVEDGG